MNLFKRKIVSILASEATIFTADLDLSKSVSKYSPDIQQIHDEFENSADNLLKEANIILIEAEKADVSKILRLQLLGFKQSIQVIELKPLLDKANLSKEQIELVAYYKREYPLQKFITEAQVKIICHKYNLVCGEVNRFKGFVPYKNLKEIEAFKLKDQDGEEWYCYGTTWDTIVNHRKRHGDSDTYFDNARRLADPAKYNRSGAKLQICAPIKNMDISGLELEDGYKLEKKIIPDPVVLQPVKGGYLVLTKWGEEASDPILINEINN